MSRREFLMLAHKFNPKKHRIGGWYMSEKLDGMRCWWDSGVTRGILKSKIPWANTSKDARYVNEPICTGLWSRYGNIIHAPDWWLNKLPPISLDGELWTEGYRQELMAVVKKLIPDGNDWLQVTFRPFDSPTISQVLLDGDLRGVNFSASFDGMIQKSIELGIFNDHFAPSSTGDTFYAAQTRLARLTYNSVLKELPQLRLPFQTDAAAKVLEHYLEAVVQQGGEGIMLRNPDWFWEPQRSHHLLKVKKLQDSECKIIGYTTGRSTDKGSKLLGKIGAFIVKWKSVKFELSGFTDKERELTSTEAKGWAETHDGKQLPDQYEAKYFKRGDILTFRYRDLTKDGMPEEARYWRK